MRPLHLKSARRRITAARDDNGVPHVVADSWRSALYALGYLHALDRATQLLFARAVASGRSAEFIADKPQLVETDRFFRRVGLDQHLDREVSALDDKTFGDLTAYCEAVNDGMKETGRSLPMWAVGFHPTPWNQKSVLLIGNLLSYGGLAVGQQQNERILVDLVQAGVDEAKLKELFSPLLDNADFDLLRKVKIANQLSDEALELITDLPRLAGSNAWAVAPWRSASGSALLAADPHLEINRLPPIWYEAVLQWGDHYVLGATLPGCPLFAVARTERLSWGVTYLKADTSDYFIEDCRPGGATGWQYRRGEEWRDFSIREEVIAHKGGEPETLRVYHNEQGTLDCDPDASGPGYLLSLAWVGSSEGNLEKIFRLVRALGRCIVFVDEADQALGRRESGSGDSGVSGRVYSMIAEEMSDTDNRGKILWILASSRPDLIEVDIKRPGRIDVKIPLFPALEPREGFALLRALCKRMGLAIPEEAYAGLETLIPELLTPGAAEALAVKAYRASRTRNLEPLQALAACLEGYQNPVPADVLELQMRLAVREATDLAFVPPALRHLAEGPATA
jgi:hypothetical protein